VLKVLQVQKAVSYHLVVEMLKNENDAVIVHATIEMGHNLGLKVVAGGWRIKIPYKNSSYRAATFFKAILAANRFRPRISRHGTMHGRNRPQWRKIKIYRRLVFHGHSGLA
jgi:hypothetical protein